MVGLHLRQTRACTPEARARRAAVVQVGGQCHSDGHLHREDLPQYVQVTAYGLPTRGPAGSQGTRTTI
jgi:hypothetical protein